MAFAGGYNTRINGEDKYTASERGEDTSRIESKLESQMEGLHAEDNPELRRRPKGLRAALSGARGKVTELEEAYWSLNGRYRIRNTRSYNYFKIIKS